MNWKRLIAGVLAAALAGMSLVVSAVPAEARGWMGRTGFAYNGHTLGTLRPNGYSEQAVCIDTDSDLPSRRTSPSKKSKPVLNYLMTKYSQTTSDIDAAALAYIVKDDLNDPGLSNAKAVLNHVGASTEKKIRARIADLRDEAKKYAGPYAMLTPDAAIEQVDGHLVGRISGIGITSDSGTLMKGIKITLKLSGPATFDETGTTSLIVTSADEPITVPLTMTGPGDIQVSASTGKVLAGNTIYIHPSPKNTSDQRMVTTGPKTAVSAADEATADISVEANVTSQASAAVVAQGAFVSDTVRVTTSPELAGKTVKATTTAYGPLDAEPVESDEIPEGIDEVETLEAELELDADGNADVTLELSNKLNQPGWYVFVEAVADNPDIGLEGTTGTFGRKSETVLVYAPGLVETKISAQLVEAGSTFSDTAIVTGIVKGAPGVTVTLTGELRGPVAPVGGKCENLDWSDAPVAVEIDAQVITEDGEYPGLGEFVTPAGQSGCYSYGETLTATLDGQQLWQTIHPAGLTPQTALVVLPTPEKPATPEKPGLRIQSGVPSTGEGEPTPALGATGLAILAGLLAVMAVALLRPSRGQ
jgi:hypothetical protein